MVIIYLFFIRNRDVVHVACVIQFIQCIYVSPHLHTRPRLRTRLRRFRRIYIENKRIISTRLHFSNGGLNAGILARNDVVKIRKYIILRIFFFERVNAASDHTRSHLRQLFRRKRPVLRLHLVVYVPPKPFFYVYEYTVFGGRCWLYISDGRSRPVCGFVAPASKDIVQPLLVKYYAVFNLQVVKQRRDAGKSADVFYVQFYNLALYQIDVVLLFRIYLVDLNPVKNQFRPIIYLKAKYIMEWLLHAVRQTSVFQLGKIS